MEPVLYVVLGTSIFVSHQKFSTTTSRLDESPVKKFTVCWLHFTFTNEGMVCFQSGLNAGLPTPPRESFIVPAVPLIHAIHPVRLLREERFFHDA
jgi:hypothetical protein